MMQNDPGAGITIRPVEGSPDADPWAAFPDSAPKSPQAAATGSDPWAQFPDTAPPAKAPGREIGLGEASLRGAAHGLSFGASPAIAGAEAAANPDIEAAAKKFGIDPQTAIDFLDHFAPGLKATYGAGRLAVDAIAPPADNASTPAQQAYSKQRQETADTEAAASEQHPLAYTGAELVGSLAAPIPGAGALKAASTLVRVGRGIKSGAAAGGLFGFGEGLGEGKSLPDTLESAGKGAAIGGLAGGALGGVLGPKVAGAPTVADRAAQTADQLGAPLPRGVVSNSPMVRATTAKLKEFPFAGEKIGTGVEKTQAAAARNVEDTAANLAGGSPTRTSVAPGAESSIRGMVDTNNKEIDKSYDALRKAINPDQHAPMPNLQKAIADIELRRSRAGWPNPGEGLAQAKNVANGVGHAGGFNGVHRLRRDLRDAGNPQKANPGYDKADFRYLKAATDRDLKNLVRHVSSNPNHAESLFNSAELQAGELIRLNEKLDRLAGQKGESIVGALVGAAKEKSGNIQLLSEVKKLMSPQSFDQLSGVLLHELGLAEGQVGEFSLARFATSWNKMSNQAKAIMFSSQHREQIENIVNLGNHLKDAGKFTNTSHTGSIIVLMDVAKDAALLFHDVASTGNVGLGTAIGAGSTLGTSLLTRRLASPKTAASMSRWTSAYRGVTLNQPTPARIAAFRIATRNLANNVNVPVGRITSIIDGHLGAGVNADEKQDDGLNK
jgi:hypothetical protein